MQNIVACIDGASYTESVCDYASWAATRVGAPLQLLHVLVRPNSPRIDVSGSIGLGAQESLLVELADLDERRSIVAREHGQQLLNGVKERAVAAGAQHVTTRQRLGEFLETLVELEESTRLFVLGQHDYQTKPKRFLLDHNLEAAIRTLHRPILVANKQFTPPQRFMIAFDGSATGRAMVELVAVSPLLRELDCHVVTVGKNAEALPWATRQLTAAGFSVQSLQLDGEPVDVLQDYAQQENIDLLIMGAYGHSRIRQWVVGSTTTALLRQSRVPVFILR